MIRYLWLSILLFSACQRTPGFTLKKITSRTPTEEKPISCNLEILQTLFDAPLAYIGSGNHTYAFATQDKKYVVKFFKQNHFGPYTWRDYVPLPDTLNPKRLVKKHMLANQRQDTFQSLELAERFLKEQTGLVYLHLHRTSNIDRQVKLIYNEKRQPICNIDQMEFIIQKCASVGFAHIDELIESGAKSDAIDSLLAYLKLIRTRCQKGLGDRDLQFFKNFGFVGNQPIEIDIGDFCILPAMQDAAQWKQELQNASLELVAYVKTKCPELLETFQTKLDELMQ